MQAIKSVLKEELQNSQRLEKEYKKLLRKLPKGSLIKKKIKGHEYYYLVYRDKSGKVCFDYKGKSSPAEVAKYKKVKEDREKYRRLLAQVRKQEQFLERAIRAGQSI